jgi:poly-gamma-glutamate synthesis protein (capsule biosynthesis protein)
MLAAVLLPLAALHLAATDFDGAAGTRPPLLLSFTGDLMHHRRNAEMPDYDRLYDSVREYLILDDLSFVNLEFPVDPSKAPDGYPVFNGSVPYVEAAIRAGLDVFALANNHTFDLGSSGSRATRSVFSALDDVSSISWNGIPEAAGAGIEPTSIYHRGWHIGFVSITAFSNSGGSSSHIHLVDYTLDSVREAFLAQVREWRPGFDLLVVGVHAGAEYVSEPDPGKQAFFRDLSDAGVDVVWGHHPHVLQPWEERDGRLIIYSAGNFISAQRRHQNPASIYGRWAPTGDTTIYRVCMDWAGDRPRVRAVSTPSLTMYDHPDHGLVLRTFDQVLGRETAFGSSVPVLSPSVPALPLAGVWREFYAAREIVMREFFGSELTFLEEASVAAGREDDMVEQGNAE